MLIKKGPYGQFTTEAIDSQDSIFDYASGIIALNQDGFFLPCYVDNGPAGINLNFDFSGLQSLPEFESSQSIVNATDRRRDTVHRQTRRRKTAEFLSSILNDINILISPSSIVLDMNFVFTDTAGEELKICLIPVRQSATKLSLSSLGYERLEELLSSSFFDGVISNDEKQLLIYCTKANDEHMFEECCQRICNTEYKADITISDSSKQRAAVNSPDKRVIYVCISLAMALISLKLIGPVPFGIFTATGLMISVKITIDLRKLRQRTNESKARHMSEERRQILFPNNSAGNDISEMNITSAVLASENTAQGISPQYAIYLDRTNIGSDCFLSDIVLDSPKVSSLHAIIYKIDIGFFISDCSAKGDTFLEDCKIQGDRRYEIKNGQKLTVGDLDFRFRTVFD